MIRRRSHPRKAHVCIHARPPCRSRRVARPAFACLVHGDDTALLDRNRLFPSFRRCFRARKRRFSGSECRIPLWQCLIASKECHVSLWQWLIARGE